MPKSNYPDKLDTSVEIPVIRDNITEIGSDVFNSLRSAIFNIEKALGINPQGAVGNTVASRLSNALDDNGNILKEALDRSNVLSGPITDADVSKAAAIDESKLRLNYPTQLLQDEISVLDNKIELFIATLEELNAILSAHVHPDAVNRHYAQAITAVAADVEESSNATMALEDGSLQEVLEEIYNAHINYTGEGIELENNSHQALQLFYNNDDTSDLIPSSSVQGAIDDLAALEGQSVRNSNLNFNSNGIVRTGSIYDEFEDEDVGTILVEANLITYDAPGDSSKHIISFSEGPTPLAEPKPFDVLTILDSPDEDDNKEYVISKVELTVDGDMNNVEVFGGPSYEITVGTTAKITRSIYSTYNENGLNCAVRPRYLKSNTPDIQVAHPNAATIISSGIKPENLLDGSVDTIALEIDGGDSVEIPLYNSNYENQTIDTIVHAINEYVVENKLNILAYKLRSLRCFELAISHILPNFREDSKNRTIKLVEASSNDASEILGMSYLLDREVEGSAGNAYHINGRLYEDFGQIKEYSSSSVSISSGTTDIDSITAEFIIDGIRAGDLCVIEGSSDSDDDGTYRIHSLDNDILTLDSAGSALSGELSEDSSVFIVRCTAPIGEMEFEEIDGLIMIDVFVDEEKNIHFQRKAEMTGTLQSGTFYAVVSDTSAGFIVDGDDYTLHVDSSGMAYLEQNPSGSVGAEVFVGGTGRYKVFSNDGMAYVVLDVYTTDLPTGSTSCNLVGYNRVNRSVLHLCRGIYSSKLGFILGDLTPGSGGAIPRLIDKRTTGTTDDTIISEPFLERYIQGPRNELRGSGIIRAASIDSAVDNADGTCTITVNPGVLVVNGVRFEYLGVQELLYRYGEDETDLNNFYIALDGFGCLTIENEVDTDTTGIAPTFVSPFSNQVVAHLGYVEPDGIGSTLTPTDLRLFVDHLDYKIIADITVANDQRFGHFTDIKTAVAYAKMFSKMFPDIGTPSIFIKEGTYYITESIKIDFDLSISGAGPNTVLTRGGDLLVGWPVDDRYSAGSRSPVFYIGAGDPTSPSSGDCSEHIINGITFENFTYKQSEDFTHSGSFITIRQAIDDGGTGLENASPEAIFRFSNINFKGIDLSPGNRDPSAWASVWYPSEAELVSAEPFEWAIHAGFNFLITNGNLIIDKCFFNYFGVGDGALAFQHSPIASKFYYKNIIVTNNIATNISEESPSSYGIVSEHCLALSEWESFSEANNVTEEVS